MTSCFFLNTHLFNHPFENSEKVRRELGSLKATLQAQVPQCQGPTVAAGSSWYSWGESGLSSQMPEKRGRHHPTASPRRLTWPRGPAATLSSPGASVPAAPAGHVAALQRPPGQCGALSALTSHPPLDVASRGQHRDILAPLSPLPALGLCLHKCAVHTLEREPSPPPTSPGGLACDES